MFISTSRRPGDSTQKRNFVSGTLVCSLLMKVSMAARVLSMFSFSSKPGRVLSKYSVLALPQSKGLIALILVKISVGDINNCSGRSIGLVISEPKVSYLEFISFQY